MPKKALRPEVAAKFNLVGIEVGKHSFAGFGEIDLSEIDLPLAEQLVTGGFQFLAPKKVKAPAVSP